MARRGASYSSDNTGTSQPTEIEVRFRKALSERGVPAAGADALLKRIRDTARSCRTGRLSDEAACAKVALLLIATEEKSAELRRAVVVPLAKSVMAGSMSLGTARQKIRGAA